MQFWWLYIFILDNTPIVSLNVLDLYFKEHHDHLEWFRTQMTTMYYNNPYGKNPESILSLAAFIQVTSLADPSMLEAVTTALGQPMADMSDQQQVCH